MPQHNQKCKGTTAATAVNTAQQNCPLFIPEYNRLHHYAPDRTLKHTKHRNNNFQ